MDKTLKAALESIIVGVVTIALAFLLFFIPVLNILVLLFPVPFVVVGARRGILGGIVSLGISCLVLALLVDPFLGITAFTLNIFIVLSLIVVYKKNLEMNEAIILSAGGVLLSALLFLQAFTWIRGESFFDFLLNNIKVLLQSNSTNIQGFLKQYQALGMLEEGYSVDRFIQRIIAQMKDLLPLFPSMLLINSLIMGSLSFLISRFVLKKLKVSTPYVPLFRNWSLPRGTGRGFLGIMLIAVIGTWMNVSNFDVVLYTVSSVFTFVFTVQGLSVVNFFLAQKGLPGVVVVLIMVVAFIFLPVALMLLGIFDQIFSVRKVYSGRSRD
ncbi:MAG: DUF2232 domain-containing protein [Clostridiales bacterium]|nr:DUF2232 domain-containing protein [Clostridiales bacterium]